MSSPRRPAAPRAPARGATRRPPAVRAKAARPATRASGATATGSTSGSGGAGSSGRQRRSEVVAVRTPRLVSVRALVLFAVTVFAFALIAPTVRSYLQQRADLEALQNDVVAARTHDEDLAAELKRWDDPAYVAAQARERLAFVLPGETAYRVVDPETVTVAKPGKVAPATPKSGVLAPVEAVPWYAGIWTSVKVAGAAGLADGATP